MSWQMTGNPLNFAPSASRHTALGWLILAVGIGVSAMGTYQLWQSNTRLAQLREQQNQQNRTAQRRSEDATRLAQNPQAQEKRIAQQKLEALLQTPWSLLLDALEAASDAVEGRVTVVSMAPTASIEKPGNRSLDLNLNGANYAAMLGYTEAMTTVGGFSNVKLVSHQLDERLGPSALRFRVTAGWPHLNEGVFLNKDAISQGADNSAPAGNFPQTGGQGRPNAGRRGL